MKRVIRIGVFETNSSSTHSLTMCSKEEYEKWSKGEIWLNHSYHNKGNKFMSKENAIDFMSQHYNDVDISGEESLRNFEIYRNPDEYLGEDMETFHEEYTTPNGETVVAIGYYGYDG